MTVGELINKIGFKVNQQDVDKVSSTVDKIKSTATKALGAIGVAFSVTALNQMVEDFGRVNDQIRNSTKALGDQKEIQEKILASAGRTRATYQQTATVVSNLVHENAQLFGTIDEAIAFNDALTMLFKAAGKTNEDIAGLMEAINKSFAKGYIDSETLSQLLERAPEAVEILNQYLGTTSDQLEQLASDGAFTVSQLKDAFVSNGEIIAQNFSDVQYRISEAITHIRDRFGYWLADLDETTGLTNAIARMMVSTFNAVMGVLNKVRDGVVNITNKFGGMQRVLRFIAITAASIFLALNIGKIISGISTAISWFKKLNFAKLLPYLKIALLAAAFVALGLIIEDFYHFMKGNDSLLGEMLERAGVDSDALREKITTTWQNIVDFITPLWEGFVSAFVYLGEQLSAFWDKYGDKILGVVGGIINAFATGITAIINFLTGSEFIQDGMYGTGQCIGALVAAILIFIAILKTASGVMSLVTSPIFWIIAAIVALIAAIGWMIDNWELVKEKASEIWGAVKDAIAEKLGAVEEFMHGFWPAVSAWLNDIWNTIVDAAKATWGSFRSFLSTLFTALWGFIKSIWSIIKAWLGNVWNQIKTTAANVWNSIKTTISNVLSGIWTTICNIWNSIVTAISDFLNSIWTAISNIWNSIKTFVSETVTSIWNKIKEAFSNMVTSISEKITDIYNTIVDGFNKAIDWIKALPAQAVEWGANIINSIVEGIQGAVGAVAEAISGVAATISSYIGFSKPEVGPLSDFDTYMPDMIALMVQGINGGEGSVAEAMAILGASVQTLVLTAAEGMTQIATLVTSMMEKIKSEVRSGFNAMRSIVASAMSAIRSSVSAAFNSMYSTIVATIANIKTTIQTGLNAIAAWIEGEFVPKGKTWGYDLIINMAEGIESGMPILEAAAQNAAAMVEKYLGFSEPEIGPLSNFHTYMPDMIALMSQGIMEGRTKVKQAMEALTGEMSVIASASYVAPSTAITAQGSHNIVKNIIQNVRIDNEFNGDKSIQRDASKAMKQTAKDVTAELAKGLNFT